MLPLVDIVHPEVSIVHYLWDGFENKLELETKYALAITKPSERDGIKFLKEHGFTKVTTFVGYGGELTLWFKETEISKAVSIEPIMSVYGMGFPSCCGAWIVSDYDYNVENPLLIYFAKKKKKLPRKNWTRIENSLIFYIKKKRRRMYD